MGPVTNVDGCELSHPHVRQATLFHARVHLGEIGQTVFAAGEDKDHHHAQPCVVPSPWTWLQKVKDSLLLHRRVDSGLWSLSLRDVCMALPFVMV